MTQRAKSSKRRFSLYLWKPHIYFDQAVDQDSKGCWVFQPANCKIHTSIKAARRLKSFNDKAWCFVLGINLKKGKT